MKEKYKKLQRTMLLEYPKIVRKVERETDTAIRGSDWGLTMEQIIALVGKGVPLRRIAGCYPWTEGAISKDVARTMLADERVTRTQWFAPLDDPGNVQARKTIDVLCGWMDEDGELQMGKAQVALESARWSAWYQGSTKGNEREMELLVLRALLGQDLPRDFRWCILDGDGWPIVAEREGEA